MPRGNTRAAFWSHQYRNPQAFTYFSWSSLITLIVCG
jgi:hypothetical protein